MTEPPSGAVLTCKMSQIQALSTLIRRKLDDDQSNLPSEALHIGGASAFDEPVFHGKNRGAAFVARREHQFGFPRAHSSERNPDGFGAVGRHLDRRQALVADD